MASFPAAWRLLDAGRDRAELYRMWRAGAAAGFTIPKTLDMMGPRQAPLVEAVRTWLLEGSRRGDAVGDLVMHGGDRFESFERALLVLGDESGTLDQALRLLAEFYARKHRLMLAVRKRMAYPLFTGVFATIIAPFPLLYFGHVLAYVAAVTVGLAAWILAGGAIVLAAANMYGRAPALVRARFARALATSIESGLPLGRAVRLSASAAGDPAVERYVEALDERTLTSQPIAVSLANCPQMSPDFLAVLQVAEGTGDFHNSLARLAEQYEQGFR